MTVGCGAVISLCDNSSTFPTAVSLDFEELALQQCYLGRGDSCALSVDPGRVDSGSPRTLSCSHHLQTFCIPYSPGKWTGRYTINQKDKFEQFPCFLNMQLYTSVVAFEFYKESLQTSLIQWKNMRCRTDPLTSVQSTMYTCTRALNLLSEIY